MDGVARQTIRFIMAAVLALVVVSLFPALSLYLPIKVGLHGP